MSNGISRNGLLPPSQTMPLCLFTALCHSDNKFGRVMALLLLRGDNLMPPGKKMFLV